VCAEAEAREFQTKGKVERKGERNSSLIRGREKEAAGSTNQSVEQAKYKQKTPFLCGHRCFFLSCSSVQRHWLHHQSKLALYYTGYLSQPM